MRKPGIAADIREHEHGETMRILMTAAALSLFLAGNALAGSGYDKCVREEKALKAREAEECSGLNYLLNPSACFATQRILKEYKAGKCRQVGIAENIDFGVQTGAPQKKSGSRADTGNAASNGKEAGPSRAGAPDSAAAGKKTETGIAPQEPSIEMLKEENIRLKAEIMRLTTENEQLRKTGR
jgi:hypothetical protein